MISYFLKKGRSSLEIKEDSLTATVFDGLKYLPSESVWEILRASLYINKLPGYEHVGALQSMSFWEHWSAKGDDIKNANFVEPDLFLRFEHADVVIEAKRHNDNQQYDGQMINQITAYRNEHSESGKRLLYIQCGGLNDKHVDVPDRGGFTVCKTDWTRLLDAIAEKRERLSECDPIEAAQIRILNDIVAGMELFQYYKKSWLVGLSLPSRPTETDNNISLKNLFSYATERANRTDRA